MTLLDMLKKLDEVEIQPYGSEVYTPEGAAEQGFRYICTLSPQLQKLGTLLNQKSRLQNTEREAFKSRTKEIEESRNLTIPQKLDLITKELPSRLEAIARLEMLVGLLRKVFNFEMACEIEYEPKAEVPTTLELKIFRDWEVAVKEIGDVRDLRGPSPEKPVEEAPRRRGQHSHRQEINFIGGKHGEA
jgi:hypothetical protein